MATKVWVAMTLKELERAAARALKKDWINQYHMIRKMIAEKKERTE